MSADPLNTYTVTDYSSTKGGEVVGASMDGGKVVKYTFSYDDLPSPVDSDGTKQFIFPANCAIRKAEVKVVTAIAGTTPTLTIGLQQADGTEIDNDGIDSAIAEAALGDGDYVDCDGALVGANIGSNAGQLVVTTGGTVTAGVFELYVEILEA